MKSALRLFALLSSTRGQRKQQPGRPCRNARLKRKEVRAQVPIRRTVLRHHRQVRQVIQAVPLDERWLPWVCDILDVWCPYEPFHLKAIRCFLRHRSRVFLKRFSLMGFFLEGACVKQIHIEISGKINSGAQLGVTRAASKSSSRRLQR